MPAQFTAPFANRLNSISRIFVKEAETGDVLLQNHAYVARGGAHLKLRRRGREVVAQICEGEPVSGHRPSVDVMMQDAAAAFGARCLGVIMTGMGHDGAEGCRRIHEAGGYVLGQDEASSDVYGMNKVAFVSGFVDQQASLDELPKLIRARCAQLLAPVSALA
jgi:two-component system chemotaxis response regulator CheB